MTDSKIVKTFLRTADYFSPDDLAKVKALQARSDTFLRHMRKLEPNLEEKHLNNAVDAYLAEPTDERLAAFVTQMDSLHSLKNNNGKALAIVETAHCAFIQAKVFPFLMEIATKLQSSLGAHMTELEAAEKKRSVELLGNEDGAAGLVAHCERVRGLLNSLAGRFEGFCGMNNRSISPTFTLRTALKEVAAIGFDVGLVEACGTLEPMVEDGMDRAAKRIAEEMKVYQERQAAEHAAAVAREEAKRKAAEEADEIANKTYAVQNGLVYVPKTKANVANAL